MKKNSISRLGIFVFFDRDGIADRYVIYMLNDIMKNLDHLVIVCNGKITNASLLSFKKYTNDIFIRENTGFDATAWKEAITFLYGWQNIYKFDELVLFNDTFFGPFYPFSVLFQKMGDQKCDFWSITAQPNMFGKNDEVIPFHLHRYFICFKNGLLHDRSFWDFWDGLSSQEKNPEFGLSFECELTDCFLRAGFHFGTYIDISPFSANKMEKNYDYLHYNTYKLVCEQNCPVIMRSSFTLPVENVLKITGGEDISRTFRYIRSHFSYPSGMIWKNLLRLNNIADLRNSLGLTYVLPSRSLSAPNDNDVVLGKKAAVIAHIFYPDLIERCIQYLLNIPKGIDLYITTSSASTKEKIEQALKSHAISRYTILVSKNRGREISALLMECRAFLLKYDYLAFLHDKHTSNKAGAETIGDSFMYKMWENLLKSPDYILNILQLFEEDPSLGLLTPPYPYSGSLYHSSLGNEWTICYQITKKLAERLGLTVDLSPDKEPFALSTSFWCRTSALKTLFQYPFRYEDFLPEPLPRDGTISHAIERILPYVAQHEGYYSAMLMNTDFAALPLTHFQYMLSEINRIHHADQLKKLIRFCKDHDRIYIYGTGNVGSYYSQFLENYGISYQAFLVSDGLPKPDELRGHPVYYRSEVDPYEKGTAIILAMAQKNENKVFPTFHPGANFFCVSF